MDTATAAPLFATLGHPGRLAVFRLLMRHAPQPVRPSDMAAALDLKANTLSHYLSDLSDSGLVAMRRDGRSLLYSIALDRAAAFVAYLTDDCCRGRADLCFPPSPLMEPVMSTRPWNVLFICSGNSARSIFAEAILNHAAGDRFRAFSAGTREGTEINPYALEILQRSGVETASLRSKHLSEFQSPDAPVMDFVFTVCDNAANEECAPWPGQPMTAHWGVPDPVKAAGTDAEKALVFTKTYADMRRRILAFAALPFSELEKVALQRHLDDLGMTDAEKA
ncbi:MAG: helix-turn-helix domain-containing protein [Rhodobacterales bacterium]|nr:helix-turn-helix domain-containing protein [Rhodobacterales bacterium]NCT13618.1 helix-turn-helix domain-containing protein [Rhodobacterales bacterium]